MFRAGGNTIVIIRVPSSLSRALRREHGVVGEYKIHLAPTRAIARVVAGVGADPSTPPRR